MKRSQFSEEQIVGILKEHQAGRSAGGDEAKKTTVVGASNRVGFWSVFGAAKIGDLYH